VGGKARTDRRIEKASSIFHILHIRMRQHGDRGPGERLASARRKSGGEVAEEFEAFVEREYAGLARYAASLTGNRALAEDVLAEALLKTMIKWRRVQRADSPAAYTRRIVSRVYLSHFRTGAAQREVSVAAPEPTATVDDPAETVASRDEVRELLELLSPRQRVAIAMRYLLDASDGEIAEAVGCSPATVRSHLSHARRILQQSTDEQVRSRAHRLHNLDAPASDY